jgi:hypothetical protein
MVLAKIRLSVSKRAVQKFDVERFNLKTLNDVELKEQYEIKISNRFPALEKLDGGGGDVDINRALGSIREYI